MSRKEAKHTRRRLRNSYLTSIISISLVLFLLGLTGILVLNAKKLSDYVKENIGFTIFLNEGTKKADVIHMQKTLDASDYVKHTEFISKQRAAEILQEDLGDNFVEFLGYNPLSASIDVKLYADYANPDSLAWIEQDLQDERGVKEVFYQKSLVHLVNDNIRKISLIILLFSGLLLVIAIALINNTIRLSVYSKRFLINTMQLVGATRGFIRRPFLLKSAVHGLYASFIAMLMLMSVLFFIERELGEIIQFRDPVILSILFGGVIVIGVFINWISTFFAVNKFLRLNTQDLYYYH